MVVVSGIIEDGKNDSKKVNFCEDGLGMESTNAFGCIDKAQLDTLIQKGKGRD
jgi:hypothetical protein